MRAIPRSGRFTIILAGIAILTIVAMTALLLWQLRLQELRHAESETVSLSHVLAEQTTRSLESVNLAMDIALDRLEQAAKLRIAADDFAIHAMLRSRIEGMPQLRSIFIADAEGRIRNSALRHPAPVFSVRDRDYFTALAAQPALERFISGPVTNRVDNTRTVFLSRRLRSSDGTFMGVIVASLDIAYIESFFDSIRLDRVGPIALYLNDGSLIAHAPRDAQPNSESAKLPTLAASSANSNDATTVRVDGDSPGVTSYRRVVGFPMIVGVNVSDVDALASWVESARLMLVGAAANILLMIAATVLLLRRIDQEEMLASVARERDNQLRAMVNSAMDAIITIDSDRRVAVFNPAAQRMFGYSEAELLGKPVDLLLPERFRTAHMHDIANFRESAVSAREKDARIDIVGLRSDGTEFPIESTIARVAIGGKEMFTAILRDVGDRRRAESELRESHRQLRELASSLQAVREEERTTIARELHDELGQQLLRLRMDLSWLSGRIKGLPFPVQNKVADMKQFIGGTVESLRRVTTRLRPPLLDELGLAEAARWQIDEFAARSGLDVRSEIEIDGEEFGDELSINMFRILQESLTNVVRHSGATRVDLTLTASDTILLLRVRDNGRGADLGSGQETGHGLVGMRERTLLLGGSLEIESAPGQGFAMSIRIPLGGRGPKGGTP